MKAQLALITLLTLAGLTLFFQQGESSYEEADLFSKYVQWKSQYNKYSYAAEEEEYRFAVWSSNFKFVEQHNAQSDDLKLAVNQFADMDLDEFKAKMLTRKSVARNTEDIATRTYVSVPSSIDWRSKGAVAPIQNQGVCGSCWAFSAVASLTSYHQITKGSLVQFSEQQLTSCDTLSSGCNGGNEYTAMKTYTPSKGVETSSSYPYTQTNTATTAACKYNSASVSYKNSGAKQITANSPDAMKEVLANQPISVALDGASVYFQLYSSGTLSTANCGTSLDHAVNIVGYNASASTPYWIVRNSWGTTWGLSGYAQLAIVTGKGVCGVQMEPCYPN